MKMSDYTPTKKRDRPEQIMLLGIKAMLPKSMGKNRAKSVQRQFYKGVKNIA